MEGILGTGGKKGRKRERSESVGNIEEMLKRKKEEMEKIRERGGSF